jgi:hypothetical protein
MTSKKSEFSIKDVTMFPKGYGKVLLRWVQERGGDLYGGAGDTTVRNSVRRGRGLPRQP